MAKLFKQISEVKEFVANDFVNEFSVIDPYLKTAEEHIALNYLGDDLFLEIIEFYAIPSSDAKKLLLLHYVKKIIAHKAMQDYIPFGNVKMSESGIHISTSEDKKTAFEWQIKMILQAFSDVYYSTLENLLVFLESNSSVFTSWKSSSLYSSIVGLLVNKAETFNTHVNINNSRLKFIELLPSIRQVEALHIIPSISQEYFDELIAQIKESNISDDNIIVLNSLQPALCFLAYAEYTAQSKDIYSSHFQEIGSRFLKKCVSYLNNNASSDKYNLFFNSDCYIIPESSQSTFFDNTAANSIFVS